MKRKKWAKELSDIEKSEERVTQSPTQHNTAETGKSSKKGVY